MERPPFEAFLTTGLKRLGIDATDAEIAVAAVADALYGPHVEALLNAELDAVAPEPGLDPSRPPPA